MTPLLFVFVAQQVLIPGGSFQMGRSQVTSDDATKMRPQILLDDRPVHKVTLHPFYLDTSEVSHEKYEVFVKAKGHRKPYHWQDGKVPEGMAKTAIYNVDWNDAKSYCEWSGVRLPTEAEWEYACRSGTTSPFHYGPALRSGMANFDGRQEYESSAGTITNATGTYLGRTSIVGSYEPNGWGLYDMHGNVFEWCLDWGLDSHGLDLPGGRVIDPQGIISSWYHVPRGGSFGSRATGCRSARRVVIYDPDDFSRAPSEGFRVVLATA